MPLESESVLQKKLEKAAEEANRITVPVFKFHNPSEDFVVNNPKEYNQVTTIITSKRKYFFEHKYPKPRCDAMKWNLVANF